MKKSNEQTAANGPRFQNRLYRVDVKRNSSGSAILTFVATNAGAHHARPRQMAAFLHEIAAQLERRTDEAGGRWMISVDKWNARIGIELTHADEAERLGQVVASVIEENDLS
jgi:hypothetical protein